MIYENDEIEIRSEYDSYTVLSELPVYFVKDNIRRQITDSGFSSVNYLNVINEKIELVKQENAEDTDLINTTNDMMLDLYMDIIENISNKFEIDIDADPDVNNISEIGDIAESLYIFLVLEFKNIMTRFFHRYIQKNKKFLLENVIDTGKKKDVTLISMKKLMKNKDEAVIVANLPKILNFIFTLPISMEDFLKFSNDDSYEIDKIKSMYSNCQITGNFVESLFEIIMNDSEIYDDLYNRIMFRFIN